jgi:hypothetical protein
MRALLVLATLAAQQSIVERRFPLSLTWSLRGGAHETRLTLAGEWVTETVAARPGEREVACRIEGARIEGAGDLARRLGRTFWAVYRDDGAVVRLRFPRDMDAGDRNLLQMIVTESQVVRGAGAQWTALERDGAGTYLAGYFQPRAGELIKRKLRYLDGDVQVRIDEAEQRLGVGSELEWLRGRTRSRILFGGGELVSELELTLGVARTRPGAAAEAAGDVEEVPVRAQPGDSDRLDRQLLGGRDTGDILAADGDGAYALRLAALFRSRPRSIDAAVARLARRRDHRVSDALAGVGSDAAVAALARLAHGDEGVAVDALTSLAMLSDPSAAALRIPLDLLDDGRPAVREAARLMAGALARLGRRAHGPESRRLDEELLRRCRSARGGERVELLSALGNSGAPASADLVEEILREGAPREREAAVRALRLVDGADAMVARAMRDGDARVRAAAVFAAGFRPRAPLEEALRQAARDPVRFVSNGARRLLE